MSLRIRACLAAGALVSFPALAVAQVCGGPVQDVADFTAGANPHGFTFGNGFDTLETTGGNPGGYLHNPNMDNFAAILSTTSPTYLGDYAARGVSMISLDFRLDHLDFGNGSGFELSLVLRDTKGTPDVSDDDYTYFVGPNIPLVGTGWAHYDFAIPSSSTAPVPAGWTGGWIGDAENFRPGVTFGDVVRSVDVVEIWTLNPAFFAIFQRWDVGADNVTLVSADPNWCDVGVGALAGSNGVPLMTGTGLLTPGSTLSLAASNGAPDSAAVLILGLQEIDMPAHGGLLVPGPRVVELLPTDASGNALFELTLSPGIPPGLELFGQYWIVDPGTPSGWSATDGVRSPTL